MKKDFVMPVFILSLICLLVSGALAAVNQTTEPLIAEAAAKRAYEARKEIIPQADSFILLEVEGLPRAVTEVYACSNNMGFIFNVVTHGYGGEIELICGISPDGRIIKSTVLAHHETQGLGTKVFDQAVLFINKDAVTMDEVDSIAGSTITFNAYRRALTYAFEAFELVR